MRLNAWLARAGVASRRGADELIKAGRVTVNGEAGQLNTFVAVDDVVALDGEPLALRPVDAGRARAGGVAGADPRRGQRPTNPISSYIRLSVGAVASRALSAPTASSRRISAGSSRISR